MQAPSGPHSSTLRFLRIAIAVLGAVITGATFVTAILVVATLALADQLTSAHQQVADVEERIEALRISAVHVQELMDDVEALSARGRSLAAERDALQAQESELLSTLERSHRVETKLQAQIADVRARKRDVELRLDAREAEVLTLRGDLAQLHRDQAELSGRFAEIDRALTASRTELAQMGANLAFQEAMADAWQQACAQPGVASHRRCVDEVLSRMGHLRSAYLSCAIQGDRPWVQTLARGASVPEAWQPIRNRTHLALCNPDLPDA